MRAPYVLSLQLLPAFCYRLLIGFAGVPKADPATLTPEEIELQAEQYASWREAVASRLSDAGRWSESVNFRDCGKLFGNFQVLVCDNDVTHEARALPFTCHLRYCPDCERRQQARQVAKYTPILKSLSEESDRDGWSLKKIELTTPYRLDDPQAAKLFQDGWEAFEHWLQLIMQQLLGAEMTKTEKRRQRLSYTYHGIGGLASAEFGEKGRKLHFHLLIYCPYVPKQMITDIWRTCTSGQAEVNWVRQIDYHDVEDAVREQVKYVTKFSALPPALVVKLADVLDGSRRLRTYGTVRGADAPEPAPCTCPACQSKISIIRVREYFERIIICNVDPDAAILAAAPQIFLDLKRGNNSGESLGLHLARSDPADLPEPEQLPGFADVAPIKQPFEYH